MFARMYLLKKIQKSICNLENFSKQKMIFTEKDQKQYWSVKTFRICKDEYIHCDKTYIKV